MYGQPQRSAFQILSGVTDMARFNGRDKAEFGVKARMLERLQAA